jgi:hypothetical protein
VKGVSRAALVALIVCLAGAVTFAQRGRNRRAPLDVEIQGNTPYDGRFVFVRLKYGTELGRWRNHIGNGGLPWSHDYPEGEVHFSKILEELTSLSIRTDGSNILALDDPELFNYPVAYMAEPGFWGATPAEAVAFRNYLLKGGFVIFDDFRGADWQNLQYQMKTVLPDANWLELDGTSRVFHSQRSGETADGHRQRGQRHQRVLGVLQPGRRPGQPHERSVQVRCQLRDLRVDALIMVLGFKFLGFTFQVSRQTNRFRLEAVFESRRH